MLSRAHRLSRALFPELLSSRRFKHSSHFTLRAAPSPENRVRAAVSVSKKVAKSAVVRNRVRRRAYAALYSKIGSMKPGLYLFVAKAGAQEVSGEALEREIDQLLNNVF